MSLAFNVEFVDPEYYKATLGDKARSKDQTFVRLMGDDMLPDGWEAPDVDHTPELLTSHYHNFLSILKMYVEPGEEM